MHKKAAIDLIRSVALVQNNFDRDEIEVVRLALNEINVSLGLREDTGQEQTTSQSYDTKGP